jgi:hypothetical protein
LFDRSGSGEVPSWVARDAASRPHDHHEDFVIIIMDRQQRHQTCIGS